MIENKITTVEDTKVNLAVFNTASALSDADKAKVREYSKLIKTKESLIGQLKKLEDMMNLIGEKWCKGYLWTNKNGDVVPVFDIEDDYLRNIVNWCRRNDRDVPKEIRKEYYARFGYEDFGSSPDSKYEPKKIAKKPRNYFADEEDVEAW